jgi:phospholipase/carboxylesterase
MNDFSLHHITRQPRRKSDGPPPVLLLMHGVGSNEEDLMGLAPALDPRLFLVSPRAPLTLGPSSFGWYHVQFVPNGFLIDEEEANESLELLLRFVDQVTEAYGVDARRLYLAGFSQGCIMSIGAALTAPEKFAGVVGMSGRLLDSMLRKSASAAKLRNLPVMLVHGLRDTVIPVADGRSMRDELQRLPVDLTYKEYDMAHHVTPESMSDISGWLTARLDDPADWRTRVG